MAGFLSSDDPFPIAPGAEAFFSPGAISTDILEPTPPPPPAPSTTQSSNQRKRQRTSYSPTQPSPQSSLSPDHQSIDIATKLQSTNPNHIIEALNKLLKLSTDHDLNYALGKHGGKIIDKLVEIYDETIGWKHGNSEIERYHHDPNEEDDLSDLIPSSKMWEYTASPSSVGDDDLNDFDWHNFCATKFAPTSLNTAMNPSHVAPEHILCESRDKDAMKRLEIIIMIVRNLSYGTFFGSLIVFT